ncbi:NAD-dependent epimerase/dehydratase family protein [Streptomyces sp. NPDC052020]|uniref:NAD-dependent epimerase/dehydratase family protein n=1 Tax=Streptomyces sp. NPDC052020 TaxID=3155677 RepID=UPI00344ACDC7
MDTTDRTDAGPADPPHAFVTGAAGFIGAHLVTALVRDGVRVSAADRVPWDGANRLWALAGTPGFRYEQADLRDIHALRRLAHGARTVFHLAAHTENRSWAAAARADYETTVGGTVCLLEAVAEQPPDVLVMTSSQLVYGDGADAPTEESQRVPRPATRFGAGKAAAEAFVSAAAHECGFRAVAARLSNIVGGGMRRGIVHDFVTRLEREPGKLTVLGDGRQTRSYLHVTDCVTALTALARQPAGSGPRTDRRFETYDVCNTDATSAAEVARIAVAEFPGPDAEIVFGGGGRGWAGDIPTLRITPQRLLALGWRPALPSHAAVRAAVRDLLAEHRPQPRFTPQGID